MRPASTVLLPKICPRGQGRCRKRPMCGYDRLWGNLYDARPPLVQAVHKLRLRKCSGSTTLGMVFMSVWSICKPELRSSITTVDRLHQHPAQIQQYIERPIGPRNKAPGIYSGRHSTREERNAASPITLVATLCVVQGSTSPRVSSVLLQLREQRTQFEQECELPRLLIRLILGCRWRLADKPQKAK